MPKFKTCKSRFSKKT